MRIGGRRQHRFGFITALVVMALPRFLAASADGTAQTKTFAIFLNKEGRPDPTYAGVLLGTNYFTFANDE